MKDDDYFSDAIIRRLKDELGEVQFLETPEHVLRQLSRAFGIAGGSEDEHSAWRVNQLNEQREREKEKEKAQAREKEDHVLFVATIAEINRQIQRLEQDLARQRSELEKTYGDDVIGGMAARFLDEETLAEIKTDEQRHRAMAELFLNADGSIKTEYQDLPEAQYIRNWNELETLKPIAEKYRGRDNFSPEERAEIRDVLSKSSITDAQNLLVSSDQSALREITESELDASRQENAELKTDTGFSFH